MVEKGRGRGGDDQGYYGLDEQFNGMAIEDPDDLGSCSDFSDLAFDELNGGNIERKYEQIVEEITEFKHSLALKIADFQSSK